MTIESSDLGHNLAIFLGDAFLVPRLLSFTSQSFTARLTMANTLSTTQFPSTQSYLSPNAPPPSTESSLQQMPNVFVIPPEEEHDENPPFCAFDALDVREGHSTSPDIEGLDVALSFLQQTDNRAPAFHRSLANESEETVVMPKKNEVRMDDADIPEIEDEDVVMTERISGTFRDDEIVEVIKVRRNEGIADATPAPPPSAIKKSKSFRIRATQALKTIKNVRKSSRKPSLPPIVTRAKGENVDGDEPMDDSPAERPTTPSLSHRKSLQLSQFFTTRSRRTSVIEPPASPTSTVGPSSSIEVPHPSRPSSSLSNRANLPFDDDDHTSPTLSSKKSFRHRISILDIPKLFSPTSPTTSSPSLSSFSSKDSKDSKDSEPLRTPRSKRESLPSQSTPPQLPEISGLSSDYSNVAQQRPHSFHAPEDRYTDSLPSSKASTDMMTARSQPAIIYESSFEMRLDSLQFESLHFDPDEF